uniref:PqqD family protein n=1 Tax=Cyanothece sp. (strain PCC 7425 / ATCC 29141) TaxID=395961 RepID=B8HXX5_CYAP4
MKEDVLVQELGGELVLLNLDSEEYFGLDTVGASMWQILQETGSIQATYDRLLEQYEVEPEQLKQDLLELIEKFVDHGLVELADS